MDNIAVILCRTKYSENIGSVARACVNMGVDEMILVSPKEFDLNKARPLATPKGKNVLERASIVSNLEVALENFNKVYGTLLGPGDGGKGSCFPSRQLLK